MDTSSRARLGVVAVALAAAATCAPWSNATSPRSAALVLAASDLPGKATVIESQTGPNSNAEIARTTSVTAEQLARWGRVTGYQRVFGVSASGSLTGDDVHAVISAINVCRTGVGAHAYFDAAARPVAPSKPVSLGDEGSVSTKTQHKQGRTLVTYRIVWRSGKYDAILILTGYEGKQTLADALALARKQQVRIVASG